MLTNPYETQVVGSLGVEIGADRGEASKCPFTSVVRDMGVPLEASSASSDGDGVAWTSEALSRLENIPEFARPMAKTGIEKFAVDRGLAQIDAQVLEQAREFFNM
jgi:hypothetical protein